MSGTSVITGGAGFIGTNMAARLLGEDRRVIVLDDLSRPGVEGNLRWLQETYGRRLAVEVGDIRDPRVVRRAVAEAEQVFHFAAQVAVTTSVTDPMMDFAEGLAELAEWVARQEAEDRVNEARQELELRGLVA